MFAVRTLSSKLEGVDSAQRTAVTPSLNSQLQHHFCARSLRTKRLPNSPQITSGSAVAAASVEVSPKSGKAINWQSLSATPGVPEPLGPSVSTGSKPGVNFAVFSEHASSVTLQLYNSNGSEAGSFPLEQQSNRTGNVWHITVEGLPKSGVLYGFRVDGEGGWESGHRWDKSKVMLDPYAPLVAGRARFGVRDAFEQFKEKDGSVFRGTYDFDLDFDWGSDYQRPNLKPEDLVIYEMCVRSFTADDSSGLPEGKRGTYLGLIEKIPHLVDLGVNAVELLPVLEYDELEFQRSPNPRDHMVNIWGYSHISFIAPMTRFAADGQGAAAAARELKELVKALHAAGIEVILDVVFNHTVEGGDDDPYQLSFRGLDNSVYYMVNMDEYHQLLNYSGCGNTVSGNHPVVKDLIITACKRLLEAVIVSDAGNHKPCALEDMKEWVEEYHVDGFRFDLASCLCRDPRGVPLNAPPLIRDIANDPVLSKVKLLAEPWDCGGLYQVGSFPNWDVWGEWNGKFRDDIRRFIKGDPGVKAAFATRLTGSADLYNYHKRKPYHSINFVIAHDGFTLHDLVSYNQKHNQANGEDNRDGSNDNLSWNCGEEGPTSNEGVLALRQRQLRNFMVALLLAQGTPMVLSGDEYAQSRGGNNNWYGHDTKMTRFEWDELEKSRDGFFRFYRELIHFRRRHPLLGRAEFLTETDISWLDSAWGDPESKFLAFTLHDRGVVLAWTGFWDGESTAERLRGQGGGDLFVAFNAHPHSYAAELPQLPDGRFWSRVVDTNLPPPKDFTVGGNKGVEASYIVSSYSSIVLLSKES